MKLLPHIVGGAPLHLALSAMQFRPPRMRDPQLGAHSKHVSLYAVLDASPDPCTAYAQALLDRRAGHGDHVVRARLPVSRKSGPLRPPHHLPEHAHLQV